MRAARSRVLHALFSGRGTSTLRAVERTRDICREEGHEPKAAIAETAQLLKGFVRDAYSAMADVDQRLRGRGFPDRFQRRNVDAEVAAMERFIDDRVSGLVSVANPNVTRLQRWKDYWANHRIGAAILFGILLITGLATLTDSVSKLWTFANTLIGSASRTPTAPDGDNRVRNGGFEAGMDSWGTGYQEDRIRNG